jgi:acetyl-CoA carboxylase biotin carboxylase subunit
VDDELADDVQNGLYDIHWLEEFLRTGGLDAG